MVYLYTTYSCEIAIYRLRDRSWTPVFTRNYIWVCVIFYKDNFYSVDQFGVLRRSLFDKSYSNYKEEVVSSGFKFRCRFRYLVESCSGELLMVVRRLKSCLDSDGQWRLRTKFFEIFKLNQSNGDWEVVRSFGDQVLFLSHNDSKFVSVRYNSEYKDNSIYFIDDLGRRIKSGSEDFDVYDLRNHKVESIKLSHGHRRMHCQWF
ncbi:uncharacterized protein LOC132300960 [Cornus florida]|uniref:uncharacterized protein LOC132300960 n=1 Tax=Cornus florida TaxID=4283 RepID=UPI0028A04D67|nr:uncharacterized protein LOC132300960 [Cornus florida]